MRLNFPFPGGVVNWLLVPASQTRTQPSAAHGKRCFGASQRNFVILFALRRVAAGFSQFTGSGREWLHRARAYVGNKPVPVQRTVAMLHCKTFRAGQTITPLDMLTSFRHAGTPPQRTQGAVASLAPGEAAGD